MVDENLVAELKNKLIEGNMEEKEEAFLDLAELDITACECGYRVENASFQGNDHCADCLTRTDDPERCSRCLWGHISEYGTWNSNLKCEYDNGQ